ncbi:hypothetical protein V5799_017861 [Amblyomma americanum]|uniref:DDE Tnp4 domain-containing protein n=1 Tax=Amblyomma americanum TaxID=6943 RepID=A0AAQ4F256_AMBAM
MCVGNLHTVGLAQPTVSKCVWRAAQKGWVRFPVYSEEKAAAKATFRRQSTIPGVLGCVDGTLIALKAPRGDPTNSAEFWSRKGYYGQNNMIICATNMSIPVVMPFLGIIHGCVGRGSTDWWRMKIFFRETADIHWSRGCSHQCQGILVQTQQKCTTTQDMPPFDVLLNDVLVF